MFRQLVHIFSISILCLYISTLFAHSFVSSSTSTTSPSIVLSTTVGHPGIPVKLNGSGFGNAETVTMYFDTTEVGNSATTSTGTFFTTITVPSSAAPGGHVIQVFGQTSRGYALASFLVRTNWVMFGDNSYHTRFNQFENVINSVNVVNLVQDWKYSTGIAIVSSPAVANGLIYIGSGNRVYALNASTGTLVWSYKTGYGIDSSPLVANGMVYIGSIDSKVYALNAITGTLVWRYTTGLSIQSSPSIANGVVYIGSNDHKLYALNATTGTLLWSYTTGSYIGFFSPAVANGVIYIGSEDRKLYALNASTGTLLWSHSIINSTLSSPAVANGVVYIGSGDKYLYAFHLPGTMP